MFFTLSKNRIMSRPIGWQNNYKFRMKGKWKQKPMKKKGPIHEKPKRNENDLFSLNVMKGKNQGPTFTVWHSLFICQKIKGNGAFKQMKWKFSMWKHKWAQKNPPTTVQKEKKEKKCRRVKWDCSFCSVCIHWHNEQAR